MHSHAARLTPKTRALIRRLIAAGKTNSQVRKILIQRGHPGDLSRSLLSFYRKSVVQKPQATGREIGVTQIRFVDAVGTPQGVLSVEGGVLTFLPAAHQPAYSEQIKTA